MKNLYAMAYTVLLVAAAGSVQAQSSPPINQAVADKPLLFNNLPDKLECNLEEVDKLFMADQDQKVMVRLNEHFQLDGMIAEKVRHSPEVLTINFRITNYPGALFTISRIIQDGVIRYAGRIISKDNGDVMMVVKEKGKYYFTKTPQRFVMTE
ncbi:MAG TPA: hypothetical protein VD993_18450 [Chitinophagaceae bacterium]|nr:hypothetical protein [Chitinophagaceae bacterium]